MRARLAVSTTVIYLSISNGLIPLKQATISHEM